MISIIFLRYSLVLSVVVYLLFCFAIAELFCLIKMLLDLNNLVHAGLFFSFRFNWLCIILHWIVNFVGGTTDLFIYFSFN